MKVKVCCISSEKEAQLAISYGAHAIGLVGPMPSGPGIISNESIRKIASNVPQDIMTFMLTSETTAQGIINHHKLTQTNTIQIVDELKEGSYSEIKEALPDVNLVQVVHVIDESSLEYALNVSQHVDYLLLDSGNPNLEVKELGGTGRTHNWSISKEIVNLSPIPVFLAGGLNPNNISEAIRAVQPFGVDVCSSLRTQGNLDEEKVKRFFDKISVV